MAFETEFKTVLVYGIPLQPPSLVVDLRKHFEVVIEATGREPTDEELAQADVMATFMLPPKLKDASQMPRLKYFQGTSAGHAHIFNGEFFKSFPPDRDMTWANASGIHVAAIGEHVVGAILILWHKFHTLMRKARDEQKWIYPATDPDIKSLFYVKELRGKTVGIMGYGHIGREAARLCHAFGANIIALNRSGAATSIKGYIIDNTGDHHGSLPVQYYSSQSPKDVTEFLGRCDVVVSTLPSASSNYRICNEDTFKAMKNDALFINIGRGDTVDQEKLVEALSAPVDSSEAIGAVGSLRIGGAALDVTDPEPLPDGHPLFTLPNVVLTPHTSGMADTYMPSCIDVLIKNMARLRGGQGALNGWKGRVEE